MNGMVCSMTGFATVDGPGFTMTVKAVNHRFLDLSVGVPPGCESLETMLRSIVRDAVKRGHVEVTLRAGAAGRTASVRRDDDLLAAWIAAYREAATLHDVAGEADLNALLRVPGVMVASSGAVALDSDDVRYAAEELMVRFNAARSIEGAALALEMRRSMDRLLTLTAEMAELRLGVREAHLERLRRRLRELVAGLDASEERLMTEAALLADRSDVEEEIVRMRTHAVRFQTILDTGGEAGKALDFLLQEMNREANTMVSKVNGAMGERGLALTDLGLAMKGEIERVKEQVQNVE